MSEYEDYNGNRMYTEDQVQTMRQMLCDREAAGLDVKAISEILMDGGNAPWVDVEEIELVTEFETLFEDHNWNDDDALDEFESSQNLKEAIYKSDRQDEREARKDA